MSKVRLLSTASILLLGISALHAMEKHDSDDEFTLAPTEHWEDTPNPQFHGYEQPTITVKDIKKEAFPHYVPQELSEQNALSLYTEICGELQNNRKKLTPGQQQNLLLTLGKLNPVVDTNQSQEWVVRLYRDTDEKTRGLAKKHAFGELDGLSDDEKESDDEGITNYTSTNEIRQHRITLLQSGNTVKAQMDQREKEQAALLKKIEDAQALIVATKLEVDNLEKENVTLQRKINNDQALSDYFTNRDRVLSEKQREQLQKATEKQEAIIADLKHVQLTITDREARLQELKKNRTDVNQQATLTSELKEHRAKETKLKAKLANANTNVTSIKTKIEKQGGTLWAPVLKKNPIQQKENETTTSGWGAWLWGSSTENKTPTLEELPPLAPISTTVASKDESSGTVQPAKNPNDEDSEKKS